MKTKTAGHMPPDVNVEDLLSCRLIDDEYTNRPSYGNRRVAVVLINAGQIVNFIRTDGRGRASDRLYAVFVWNLTSSTMSAIPIFKPKVS